MQTQPSNSWTVQLLNPDGSNSGTVQTLAALGIDSATFDLNNLAADVLTFTVGGAAFDAATLWPYGQLLALLKPDGTRFFVGRVEPWSREGSPDAQDHIGRIVNPWWYLENKVYQQRYNIPIFDSGANITGYNNYTTPRVVLYVLYQGAPTDGNPATGFYTATTGQQIADAINWAISLGAPITLGQMDPASTPFSSFQKGVTCAEVLRHAFRFEPDFSVVWDYTTTPFPTINVYKQQSFTPLTIDLTKPGILEKITVKERPDWQKSYVAIFYDQTENVGGSEYIELDDDIYPQPLTPPAGMSQTEFDFRGVDLFCDLTGEKIAQQNQQANFASKPFNLTDIATWQNWKPDINPANDSSIAFALIVQPDENGYFQIEIPAGALGAGSPAFTLPSAGPIPGYAAPSLAPLDELDVNGNPVELDTTCTNEIVDGAWADWISGTLGYTGPLYTQLSSIPPVPNGQRVRATGYIAVVHYPPPPVNGTWSNPKWEIVSVSHDFTATNINTNGISENFTMTTATINQYAEPVPYGLAEDMFNSWQRLAIEGQFQNVEAVIGATQPISRKNCLNFNTPNQPAWASVNAVIQKMSGDIGKGVTLVEFGAPLHLTGNALIDAVRATRYRITTIDLAYIFGGALVTGAGITRMSRKHHARHSQNGQAHQKVFVVSTLANPAAADPTTALANTITLDPNGNGPVQISIAAQDILAAWNMNSTKPTS